MTSYPRFIHRTLNVAPSDYEKKLSGALLQILSRKIHDLPGIVAALNQSDAKAAGGQAWTEESFAVEMERLGAYPNCVGAPLGSHRAGIVPAGTSTPERPMKQSGGQGDAR
ncbi:MAG TPA: recombinase-like helix-turn-helix domain-containing protein [Stellaceae bacterium]|nr:recombinase-like helix-turn-helix domain-containing protein [Stellaceae bacterium]